MVNTLASLKIRYVYFFWSGVSITVTPDVELNYESESETGKQILFKNWFDCKVLVMMFHHKRIVFMRYCIFYVLKSECASLVQKCCIKLYFIAAKFICD